MGVDSAPFARVVSIFKAGRAVEGILLLGLGRAGGEGGVAGPRRAVHSALGAAQVTMGDGRGSSGRGKGKLRDLENESIDRCIGSAVDIPRDSSAKH